MSGTDDGGRGPAASRLPDLSAAFPGPFPVSPHAADVAGHLEQWLGKHPLIESERARAALCDITGHGVARTFPGADPAGLELTGDLLLWLTAFDDAHGEAAGARDPAALVRRVADAVHVLDGRRPPFEADVFGTALADVVGRLRERAAPERFLRVAVAVRDSLYGLVWEAHELAAGGRVSVARYRAMRPDTVFVRTVASLAEPVLGYELPPAERESEAVRDLESAVSGLAGSINDLASYQREKVRAGGAEPFSLPTLLAAEEGCGSEEAFAGVAALCEADAARARRRIAQLTQPDPGRPAAVNAARAAHARAWEGVAASYVWHIGHGRYGGSGSR
ncbi:terpene synthase family protein, partial [Streptomyces fuscigenes]|uniref:terpene synthase family protein n=1 Tax=Streptomyces fuscigenes TaxID=1528880 RepID=UPI001F2D61F6